MSTTAIKKELYGLSTKFITKPGKGSELATLFMQAATSMTNVKGCILYIVNSDAQNIDRIGVFEVWVSKEDHDNALTIEGSEVLIAKAMPLMNGRPESVALQILGGHGLA